MASIPAPNRHVHSTAPPRGPRHNRTTRVAAAFLLLTYLAQPARSAPREAAAFVLERHCLDCHDADTQKGDVRLDGLDSLPLEPRLELLNRLQEQVHLKQMPPEKKKPLTAEERNQVLGWVAGELGRHQASKLEEKLAQPDYGNFVDHDELFSGAHANLPGYTPDRRWLISEYIFDAKFNRLLNHAPTLTIDGKRQPVVGENNRWSARVNLTNPFLLPTHSGVRYYANTTLDGGHLLTMLTNARETSAAMIERTRKNATYLPAAHAMLNPQWQREALLAARESFLTLHIDLVLKELQGEKHASLLPAFVRLPEPVVLANDKKAGLHSANPGNDEMEVIFRSMRRHEKAGHPDAEWIEACEREWFYHGHDARKVQIRLTFLANYMVEWRAEITRMNFNQRWAPVAYKPLAPAEMEILHATLLRNRRPGDRYSELIARCHEEWEAESRRERELRGGTSDKVLASLVGELFVKILERKPTSAEADSHLALAREYQQKQGDLEAVEKLIQTLLLNTEFVYRQEFGQGEPDAHGRRMLSPRDLSYALAYALTDSSPDKPLAEAAASGRLNTREDVRREVERMLKRRDQYSVVDEAVQAIQLTSSFTSLPIRELRFFRDFFGYPQLLSIFKDNKRFGANYDNAKGRLVGEADMLVEHILETDRNVIETLLTTDSFYVFHSGDNAGMTESAARIRRMVDYFKDKNWASFTFEDLMGHKEFLAEVKMRGIDTARLEPSGRYNPLSAFISNMKSYTRRLDKGQTAAAPYDSFPSHGPGDATGRTGQALRSPEVALFFNIALDNWSYPPQQPAPMPHRLGMLTHPAWLVAHAHNTATDPIQRGKWVREKLLAGTVPKVPITVDAVIPEDHHQTLRSRLARATEKEYCWKCHERMNPIGYSFEVFDDFGRFRTAEELEHPDNRLTTGPEKGPPEDSWRDTFKTLPVDGRGFLAGTGDPKLDGEVTDAFDLIRRLAKSDRVRQSILRHAFRYFMGRNETLSDSKTLIDADRAYRTSGGSFDAVIVSLLTSDSFLYRKPSPETAHAD